jgi:hypothetical protein
MASPSYGPGSKKEPANSGSSSATTGTVYSGPPMPGSTGTVYQGPTPGGPASSGQRPPVRGPQRAAANSHKAGVLFYYIAALSVVNTVIALAGVPIALAIGLGITRMIDASLGRESLPVALLLDVIVASMFVALGFFATKGNKAAFLIGLVLYGLDMVLLFSDAARHIPSLLVHGYFIYMLIKALRDLD